MSPSNLQGRAGTGISHCWSCKRWLHRMWCFSDFSIYWKLIRNIMRICPLWKETLSSLRFSSSTGRVDLSHRWLCKGVQLLQNVNVLFCTVKYFLSAPEGVIVTTWKSLLPRYRFSIQVAHLPESNQGEKMDILFKQSAFSPCRMSPHHQKWWIQQCGTISGAGVLCKEEKWWDPPCGYDSYHNNPATTDVIQS